MAKVYPISLRVRPELNHRHGIKPSVEDLRGLISLATALYLSNPTSALEYCVKKGAGIAVSEEVFNDLKNYFAKQLERVHPNDFRDKVNKNPLFTTQMEPVQVALELFLKICKVKFSDGAGSSQERTGGNRYPKTLYFTTNIEIIRLAFQNNENEFKQVLFDWIIHISNTQESELTLSFKKLITIFSEETQFKLRQENEKELFFQQEGIYQALLVGNEKIDQDNRENVGPLRILKTFVSQSLHPFLRGQTQFSLKETTNKDQLRLYAGLVQNYLDTIPKRTTLTVIEKGEYEEDLGLSISLPDLPRNCILYGPPGSGKSHRVDNSYAKDHAQIRVTFHPDSDYHSFVGSYKPLMDGEVIMYDFQPQAFTNAYISAWSQPERPIFLIIEEINRGNCAQIFGDLFQCLDRNKNEYSVYPVDADTDLATYLTKKMSDDQVAAETFAQQAANYKKVGPKDYHKLILPPNLYLYATMNTSDQSLFPMDSAFKRRWDWEYVPINYHDANEFKIDFGDSTQYRWGDFISTVNARIYELNKSEDKQLGNRFVAPDIKGVIKKDVFKSKVMFYLWSEIYKNETEGNENIFVVKLEDDKAETKSFRFSELFEKNVDGTDTERVLTLLTGFMRQLGLEPISRSDE